MVLDDHCDGKAVRRTPLWPPRWDTGPQPTGAAARSIYSYPPAASPLGAGFKDVAHSGGFAGWLG